MVTVCICRSVIKRNAHSVALGLALGSQLDAIRSFFSACRACNFSFIWILRSTGGTKGAGAGGGVVSNKDKYWETPVYAASCFLGRAGGLYGIIGRASNIAFKSEQQKKRLFQKRAREISCTTESLLGGKSLKAGFCVPEFGPRCYDRGRNKTHEL